MFIVNSALTVRNVDQILRYRTECQSNLFSIMASVTIGSRVTEVENKPLEKPVDREKTCPLLLRVFCSSGRHHRTEEFDRGRVPPNELQIYTWMDASLKELSSLVKEVNPEARRRGTFFSFAIVAPESRRPGYHLNQVGMTCSGRKGPDDTVTLASSAFQIGDYIDIAISLPTRGGGPPPLRRDSWGRM